MSSRFPFLGRQPAAFDPRNLNFPIVQPDDRASAERTAVLAARGVLGDTPSVKYHWAGGWHGDQGDTPSCTAFAALHTMADGPVTYPDAKTQPRHDPLSLYELIRATDRAEGRYFDEGATMLAMAKTLKKYGYISVYFWGYTLADFLAAIRVGPVMIGVDWHEGMFYPDRKFGVARAFGTIAGGHAIEANGADFQGGMARFKQSWGRSHGREGVIYVPFEDLERLLAAGGEVLAVEEIPDAVAVPIHEQE